MTHEPVDDTTKEIISGLPAYYPRNEDSPNYKLFRSVAQEVETHDTSIDELRHAIRVQDQMAPDLEVHPNSEYKIRAGDTTYKKNVVVEGTLIVEGTLYAEDVEVGATGSIDTSDGELIVQANLEEFIKRLERLGSLVGIEAYEGETIDHYRARIIAEYAVMTCESTIEDMLTSAATILSTEMSNIGINDRLSPAEVELQIPAMALDNVELSDSEISTILERLVPASYTLSSIQKGTFTYITPSQYDLNDHDASKGYDGLDSNGDPKDNGGTYAGLIT